MNLINILFAFSFFSILGWFLEVIYRSLRDRQFINPGLLKGPYLILYGAGSLVLLGCIPLLVESNLVVKALVYFVATTGLELIGGLIGQYFSLPRLWDYSDQRFQYKGHICLKFSLYWVLLAFAFEYLIFSPYQNLLIWISPGVKGIFTGVLISAMTMDIFMVWIRRVISLSPEEKTAMEIEYLNYAGPLLENPVVTKLSQYEHHRGKSRLEHVREVAWLSFLWSEHFSLDSHAVVRGALLHDLFFYDWLREGPRLHGLRHHNIALRNARKITSLSPKEEDIIKKHMWPLTVIPPIYPESLIVSLVDTFYSTIDYLRIKTKKKAAVSIAVFDDSEC